MNPTRRELMHTSAILGVMAGAGMASRVGAAEGGTSEPGSVAAASPPSTLPTVKKGDMLYRPLGRTGEQVSIVGLGGHHIGRPADENEGIRIIRHAIDHGITFMDNCWDYHDGGSEREATLLRIGHLRMLRQRKPGSVVYDVGAKKLGTHSMVGFLTTNVCMPIGSVSEMSCG